MPGAPWHTPPLGRPWDRPWPSFGAPQSPSGYASLEDDDCEAAAPAHVLPAPVLVKADAVRSTAVASLFTEELPAARRLLARQLEARRTAVSEQLLLSRELEEFETEAAEVRQQACAFRRQVLALESESPSAKEVRAAEAQTEAVAMLEVRNESLESHISEARTQTAKLHGTCRASHAEGEQELLELRAQAGHELGLASEGVACCEEQIALQEQCQGNLHSEYSRQNRMLQTEISRAEEASCQEAVEVMLWEREAALQQRCAVAERDEMSSRLEELRLLAADSACKRSHVRRFAKAAEARAVQSACKLRAAEFALRELEAEGRDAEQRASAAEAELAGRGAREAAVAEPRSWGFDDGQPWAPQTIQEELRELQLARWQLSEAERRSRAAQEGLAEAVAELVRWQPATCPAQEAFEPAALASPAMASGSSRPGHPVGVGVLGSPWAELGQEQLQMHEPAASGHGTATSN